MLLSLPTWFIHLFTVTEWGAAIGLFWHYGTLIQRRELHVFAVCMMPHLIGGLLILLFHLSGDTQRFLLDIARLMTFCGSLLLLVATLTMLFKQWSHWLWRSVPIGLIIGVLVLILDNHSTILLQAANLCYLLFLLTLLLVYRSDQQLFSLPTIAGFWFLLVFVAATIFSIHIATTVQGLPSLSHNDFLHGLSESLLSLSNLLIATGAVLRIKTHGEN
ncbi:DUF2499 domain-containing protein [Chromatium okenii]|uniref:DUF2499 domain-containing protein n=1 Tax=Chromatium okenii TaxID=61644 RepID=UPI0026F07EEE|nr:DUF2499 domain-containing protein [Chromatium okenii]MBV5308751.1 DUF2499 domain-containing protein [Chromatium okenii]